MIVLSPLGLAFLYRASDVNDLMALYKSVHYYNNIISTHPFAAVIKAVRRI